VPHVHGFLIISVDSPSFVVPLFVDRPGSNHSLIQEITTDDRVASFLDVDVGNNYEITQETVEIEIGDPALWGFRSLSGEIILGTASEVSKVIKRRLHGGEYRAFPLIETQIAKFCKNARSYASALARSFQTIQKRSSLMANIWRDSVILLPVAKKELARNLPRTLLELDIDNVRLFSHETRIEIIVPHSLLNFYEPQKSQPDFSETLNLGKSFGLSSLSLTGANSDSETTWSKLPTFNETYGELKSFTGIGDLVEKNLPFFNRTHLLIPPWIGRGTRPGAKPPLMSFCVMNTEKRRISAALQFASNVGQGTVKIAIVTLPITFGTSKGHKLDISELISLKPIFDYIFIVGNHVLQKPIGLAPRLAASSRAVKYVKACVDGLMQIVWASTGPKSANNFYEIFSRDGFGLVGRGAGRREYLESSRRTSAATALRDALGSALNERLPLHHGKRLVVVGPASIVNDALTIEYMNEAAHSTANEVLSVETNNPKPTATILGFGIKLVKQTDDRLREFCLELLHVRNFTILRVSKTNVVGRFGTGPPVTFGFSPSERSVDHLLSLKAQTKKRYILTNYTPSNSLSRHCKARKILIFHYSLLDEILSENLPARRAD
jgi:hypothetical protein